MHMLRIKWGEGVISETTRYASAIGFLWNFLVVVMGQCFTNVYTVNNIFVFSPLNTFVIESPRSKSRSEAMCVITYVTSMNTIQVEEALRFK